MSTAVNGVTYTLDNNRNLLSGGVNIYTYDHANRLKTFNNTTTSANHLYNSLNDRLRETVSGITTTFTMDLNMGLTQALSDGTNHYIYGNGRIAQATGTTTEYFLGDALGSVRQLVNAGGSITYSRAYDPYGVVTSTLGDSQTSYAFTGEFLGDSTQLTYLRSRFYASSTGRFLTRDTWMGDYNRPLSLNRWNYVNGNPINFSDPSGRYSAIQIAKSYGVSPSQLIEALETGKHISGLQNKWGWINLLLDAHDGQSVKIGSPASFPPFLDKYPVAGIKLDTGDITIGGRSLNSYTNLYLMSPILWWRNTKPSYYYLDSAEYFDSTHDLPNFRTLNVDGLMLLAILFPPLAVISEAFDVGGAITIDSYGNIYRSVYGAFAPSLGLGVGVSEGYINSNPTNIIPSITGNGYRPSEQEIHDTLTSWCFNGGVNIGPAAFQGSVCGSLSMAFLYGYTPGLIGTSLGPSFTWEPIGKKPELAWNYLNEKPNVSKSDLINRITLDLLINPCP